MGKAMAFGQLDNGLLEVAMLVGHRIMDFRLFDNCALIVWTMVGRAPLYVSEPSRVHSVIWRCLSG